MRLSIASVAIALLVAYSSVSAQADGRKLALLVGVERYDHSKLDLLEYCGDDVTTLERLLTRQGFRCVVLRNEKEGPQPAVAHRPTAKNINEAVKALLKGVTREDLILVVLTGHGLQPTGESQPYFCPQDANPSIDEDGAGRQTLVEPDSLVGIGTLLKRLDQSGVGHKLVLVDACRNAPQMKGLKGIKGGVDSVAFDLLPAQCGVLLSCSQGQFSFENKSLGDGGRGAFLHHVILGLEGKAADEDGEISWDDLTSYVKKSVPKTVAAIYAGTGVVARQTPEGINRLAGSLVLAKKGIDKPVPLPMPMSPRDSKPNATDAKSGFPEAGVKAGQRWDFNRLKMTFCWCPSGEFRMGSPLTEAGRDDDEAQKEETVSGFWISKHEITHRNWRDVDDFAVQQRRLDGPVQADDDLPVDLVNWDDARSFCRRLTERGVAEKHVPPGWEFRLPTEIEWEYACRADTDTPFAFGDTLHSKDTRFAAPGASILVAGGPADVTTLKANAWGIAGMHGNVWEWCQTEPRAVQPIRGGSWDSPASACRSASRSIAPASRKAKNIGFRPVIARVRDGD
jgi:hypothetical protein